MPVIQKVTVPPLNVKVKGSFINYVVERGGGGFLGATPGHEVLKSGEGVRNVPKLRYVIYEQP